jgi:phage-related protein
VYVLHCFQKKSKSGISTPKQDMDLIEKRLKIAEMEHQEWQKLQNERKPKALVSQKKAQ